MSKDDKAMLRALAWQLVGLAMMKTPKKERYLAGAEAAEQVAARLRERAEEA